MDHARQDKALAQREHLTRTGARFTAPIGVVVLPKSCFGYDLGSRAATRVHRRRGKDAE